jgi:hypothetical protein
MQGVREVVAGVRRQVTLAIGFVEIHVSEAVDDLADGELFVELLFQQPIYQQRQESRVLSR